MIVYIRTIPEDADILGIDDESLSPFEFKTERLDGFWYDRETIMIAVNGENYPAPYSRELMEKLRRAVKEANDNY